LVHRVLTKLLLLLWPPPLLLLKIRAYIHLWLKLETAWRMKNRSAGRWWIHNGSVRGPISRYFPVRRALNKIDGENYIRSQDSCSGWPAGLSLYSTTATFSSRALDGTYK